MPTPDGVAVRCVVELDAGAVATSGDYRRFVEHAGRRHPHVIDPRTGRPVTHGIAAVSVIAPSAMTADALSTALMVPGPEDGPALAARLDIAALFTTRRAGRLHEHATRGFRERMLA